jgi:hypothetical protein
LVVVVWLNRGAVLDVVIKTMLKKMLKMWCGPPGREDERSEACFNIGKVLGNSRGQRAGAPPHDRSPAPRFNIKEKRAEE